MAQALRLIWSDEALDDIDKIADYISRDSPYYAQRVVEALIEAVESLPEQPYAGRMVPELGQPAVRERFVYSFRLIYEILPEALHVLAVIHGQRLLDGIEKPFESG